MELWKDWGYQWDFTWCGVGSRDNITPEIRSHMVWIGESLALMGGVLCTGDAPGSDTHFWEGYNFGRQPGMPPAQVYYTQKKNQRGSVHNAREGLHELERYPETQHIAQDIAFDARGSFEGLFPSGIALHTRNAFQVLGEDLKSPRRFTVFFAKPVGKQGLVAGGTNTSVQISRRYKIPTINLWLEDQRDGFAKWITDQLTQKGIPIPERRIYDGQTT